MPTNRTRTRRGARSNVTDEARAIYAEALKLQPTSDEHYDRRGCPGSAGKYCRDCLRYRDLKLELDVLLCTKWLRSPLECDTEEPPLYMRENSYQSGLWRKAFELRCELEREQ
jgi:hypothetical protein